MSHEAFELYMYMCICTVVLSIEIVFRYVCDCSLLFFVLMRAAAQDKNTGGGRGQKQGGRDRGGDRERGDRQDNRRPPSGETKEREDRPPRGQNAGGRRQRLPSKEKDRVRVCAYGVHVPSMCTVCVCV